MDYSTVHAKLRKLNINLPNNHNRLKFDNTVFDKIDTEEKAYWLGFIVADGYLNINKHMLRIKLGNRDRSHLIKFIKFVGGNEEMLKLLLSQPVLCHLDFLL